MKKEKEIVFYETPCSLRRTCL